MKNKMKYLGRGELRLVSGGTEAHARKNEPNRTLPYKKTLDELSTPISLPNP